MNKMRSDSTWNRLSTEQKERLEHWLFVENVSYKQALERCAGEFEIKASLRSLAEYYQRLADERAERRAREIRAQFRPADALTPAWKPVAGR